MAIGPSASRVTTGLAGWCRPRSSKPVGACPARHSGRFDSDASLAPKRLWTITGRCTKAGYTLREDVLSPVIVGKAPGLSQSTRHINWLFLSTQAPESPQRASWPFRLNALTRFFPTLWKHVEKRALRVKNSHRAEKQFVRLPNKYGGLSLRRFHVLPRRSTDLSYSLEVVKLSRRPVDPPMSRSYAR